MQIIFLNNKIKFTYKYVNHIYSSIFAMSFPILLGHYFQNVDFLSLIYFYSRVHLQSPFLQENIFLRLS